MESIADDVKAIKARMQEIAKEERLIVKQLDNMQTIELDIVGYGNHMPRKSGETDYLYRTRLKESLAV